MELNEVTISKAIIDRYYEKLTSNLETDVAIVGGGHSGGTHFRRDAAFRGKRCKRTVEKIVKSKNEGN